MLNSISPLCEKLTRTPLLLSLATELVTPPLDGMILPGVTRDSVLALAREHESGKGPIDGMPEGKFIVSERPVTMKEVKDAARDERLVEFFGTGECDLRDDGSAF